MGANGAMEKHQQHPPPPSPPSEVEEVNKGLRRALSQRHLVSPPMKRNI